MAGLLSLAVVLQSTSSFAGPSVVFVNPGFEEKGFWRAVTQTMQAAAERLGFSLEVLYGDREWPKMVANAQAVLARDELPDYLILVNEHQQAPDLLIEAERRGLPGPGLLPRSDHLRLGRGLQKRHVRGRRLLWSGRHRLRYRRVP